MFLQKLHIFGFRPIFLETKLSIFRNNFEPIIKVSDTKNNFRE